ncbi:hypothetical protein ACLH0K_09995 [Arthrobacter sp. MPF02]|uniref:hypothetical protein n=1 Tax=Arthrobacter sp. MPF02 TaxID=3388492 RepID=UPI003984B3DB
MSQEQPPILSRRELRKARDAQQAAPPADRPPAVPAAGKPEAAGAAESTHTQRSSQIRARDRAALRTIKELEEKEGQLAGGGPPTRRQLRLQQLKEQALTAANPVVAPASGPAAGQPAAPAGGNASGQRAAGDSREPQAKAPAAEKKPAAGPGAGPQGMTVEQALAARALIAEQAKNQLAKMEHIASLDPEAVDPDILAEQIALAERAAVMNRRAIAKQKLAEQAGTPVAPAKDPAARDATGRAPAARDRPSPSTADNLAMVTPLEFVQVPGVDRPVMKPPATSHVPVTTRPGSKVKPGSKVQPGSKVHSGAAKRRPASRSNTATPEAASGRSQVIARAEAAARAATRPKPVVFPENQHEDLIEDLPRIPASSAYGLDPLDAATAGLARAKRNRILQICVLLFGIVALVSGILLIVSGISG